MQNQLNKPNYKPFLSNSFDRLFDSGEDKLLVDCLVRYVITGDHPITTPELWQDVAIYIRYHKRDVWAITEDQHDRSEHAILVYRIKYIINHLNKQQITNILAKFYKQAGQYNGEYALSPRHFFEQQFHAPVDSLFLTQEKLIIDKQQLQNFDQDFNQLFEYPSWLEFTDSANQLIFSKIMQDELTDEQIDYFLGASDTIKNYDQWFKVIKHILKTTHNSHTFWTAGDVLNIIRKAFPKDQKSQKWINDQIFAIFWPRIGNLWPLENRDRLRLSADEDMEILNDSVNWLQTLDDLNTRLPELKRKLHFHNYDTDDHDFHYHKDALLSDITNDQKGLVKLTPEKAVNRFGALADFATSKATLRELHGIADDTLLPYLESSTEDFDKSYAIDIIHAALAHAENYLNDLAREQSNLIKHLINQDNKK
ncbi:hypothetical protein IKG60_00415 [Candidatus Saccharibacteria bacterium]|nr:hypothetical protein [Candidatus Saccharibacteria bacterium]